MAEIRIEYDDRADQVIDKVNEMLATRGIQFKSDNQEHDGFVIYVMIDSSGN